METVVNSVHPESWRDRRTGGEDWGSSASRPKLLFKRSTSQATYIHARVPSSLHFSSGFGNVSTLLVARLINHVRL